MRNKHTFKGRVALRCPMQACGHEFHRTVTVEYVTNQRGDVIGIRCKIVGDYPLLVGRGCN